MKRVLFQGDSITDMMRSRENDKFLGIGYPVLVSAELGLDYPGEYEFLNRGVSGNRIVDLYARIKSDIINLKPDVISFLIGINDVWHELGERYNGVDAEKYYTIYSMLISEVKATLPDTKIMILEPFVLKGSGTEEDWEYFSTETLKRAVKAKKLAEKFNLKFVPLQSKFDEAEMFADSSYWLWDGVHPNYPGHEIIKREWIKAFKEIV